MGYVEAMDKLERVIQQQWDLFKKPVELLHISVTEKHVHYSEAAAGSVSNPMTVLDAGKRLALRAFKKGIIQDILVTRKM